jgi:hypothetical protein
MGIERGVRLRRFHTITYYYYCNTDIIDPLTDDVCTCYVYKIRDEMSRRVTDPAVLVPVGDDVIDCFSYFRFDWSVDKSK